MDFNIYYSIKINEKSVIKLRLNDIEYQVKNDDLFPSINGISISRSKHEIVIYDYHIVEDVILEVVFVDHLSHS